MPDAPFRVLIVDDHPVVIYGIRLLFKDHPQFTVCGEAATAADALRQVAAQEPDFIIADLVLGERDGTTMIEDMAAIAPTARILIYSSQDELIHARHALRAGARGYVSKTEGLESVEGGLNAIAAGGVHVSKDVQDLLTREYARRSGGQSDLEILSARELQILQLIGQRFAPQELARKLSLSVKTIGTFRERLKAKLGLDTVRDLERIAEAYVKGDWPPNS
jgi:DNA-binding NarL/FixJ family response regulator